jgi:hypothetical protein
MFVLVALELTGVGQAIAQLGREWIADRAERREAKAVSETLSVSTPAPVVASDSPSEVIAVTVRQTAMVGGKSAETRLKPERQPMATEFVGVPPGQRRAAMVGGEENERRLKPELQPPPPTPSNWPAALWITGTAAALCWMIAGRIAAGSFRRRCSVMNDGELYDRVADLRTVFAIKRPVVLLSSPRTASPIVFGGRRPALVLPANFRLDFDRQQQDAILAHELAHLAARDARWQSAALVLCGLLWWHPLVWWSRRQLRAAHEAVADEGSLVVPDGPRVLAEALVALGQRLFEPQPRFGLSLGGGRFRSGLGRRVQRLLNLPQRPWRAPRRTRMAFAHFSLPALVALGAIFFGTAWAPSQAPITRGETTMSILSTSWRGSLIATALCAMLGNTPSSAVADDNPSPQPKLTDREALQAKFQAIRARAAALDEQGKHDEADRLRREAKQMMSKIHGGSDDPRAVNSTPANPERDKIIGRVKEMMDKANQLQHDGKTDEADKLRRQAKEIYANTMRHTPPAMTQSLGPNPEPQLKMLRDHYMALQDKMKAAKEDGNEEQVRAIGKEIEALRARQQAMEADATWKHAAATYERTAGGGDREARLKHLRAAAENLKAAGCSDEAKHVMELIGRMESEARSKNELSAYASREGKPGQVLVFGDGGNAAAVQELRAQLEEMRKEMRVMRDELNRAKNGERR